MKLAPMGDEPEWLRLIRFKPTHNAFRNLQGSYVDGRLHLSDLVAKGTERLQKIQKELADEQAQLEQMCSQFITKDNKITDSVIEDTKGANAAANQRKREIASLFSEVQKT